MSITYKNKSCIDTTLPKPCIRKLKSRLICVKQKPFVSKHDPKCIDTTFMQVLPFYSSVKSPQTYGFSNLHLCDITEDGTIFKSAEHYYMYHKAKTFHDHYIANKILQCKSPLEAKKLGQQVKGYVDRVWVAKREDVMINALRLKFQQNEELKQKLLATQGKLLAEASPIDKTWGIGLAKDDSRVQNPKEWRGQNLLGKLLMKVRDELLYPQQQVQEKQKYFFNPPGKPRT